MKKEYRMLAFYKPVDNFHKKVNLTSVYLYKIYIYSHVFCAETFQFHKNIKTTDEQYYRFN